MRLIALGVACLSLCAQPNDPQPNDQRMRALAAALSEQIDRHSTPVGNADAQAYIAAFGTRLGYPQISLTLVDRSGMPPFEPAMLPDRCVVSSSLVLAAHDESELAAVLAQALARGFRVIGSGTAAPGTIPLFFIVGQEDFPMFPKVREQTREIEMEADRAAVIRMASLGFDPGALARYLRRVQPKLTDRIAAAEAAVRGLGPVTVSAETGDFERIQRLLRPAPRTPPSLLRK